VQFVVNIEEGGERNMLHGDQHSEYHLSETPTQPLMGMRNMIVESFYEYGSRVGFWRIMRLFEERAVHFTAFLVGMALERNPEAARAMFSAGHEVATHGYRWVDYNTFRQRLRESTSTRRSRSTSASSVHGHSVSTRAAAVRTLVDSVLRKVGFFMMPIRTRTIFPTGASNMGGLISSFHTLLTLPT
jgi:peptidoglycan/xylan/chitin deacetylase (PgdA/CDA1 family)